MADDNMEKQGVRTVECSGAAQADRTAVPAQKPDGAGIMGEAGGGVHARSPRKRYRPFSGFAEMQEEIRRRTSAKLRRPKHAADIFGFRLADKATHRIAAVIVGQLDGRPVICDRKGKLKVLEWDSMLYDYLFLDGSAAGICIEEKLDKKLKKCII